VFTLAFFPVTIRGFTGTMHYLLGDTGSAVTDFYRFMPNQQVIATVAAIDTISQEEIRGDFLVLGANRVPYHGPQGTSYENHRVLAYAHSMGAKGGRLD